MKKSNSLLNNKYILYLLFILTLINIAYLIYLKDNYSILIFGLIAILIYLFTKNMIIILGLSIFIINILVLARDSREGYTDPSNNECSDFTNTVYKNLYSSDISGIPIQLKDFKDIIKPFMQDTLDGSDTDNEFYRKYKNEAESLDNKSQKWLKDNIIDLNEYKDTCYSKMKVSNSTSSSKNIEPLENEIGESIKDVEKDGKRFNNMIEKVKKGNPEMEEVINKISGFDMNELNKLINKLNTLADGAKS